MLLQQLIVLSKHNGVPLKFLLMEPLQRWIKYILINALCMLMMDQMEVTLQSSDLLLMLLQLITQFIQQVMKLVKLST